MELIQKELNFFTPTAGKFSGFTETTDAIIPDSYPDIEEVVFSRATINVKDELPQADRILVSGQIDAVILYRPSNSEEIFRLNIPLSFAHIEEAPGIDDQTVYFMRSGIAQTDVRIVNSRKISVSCSAVIQPELFQHTTARLTTSVTEEQGLLEQHGQSNVLPLITAVSVQRFVILDDLEMEQGKDAAPLHTEVELTGTECSVNNGRIILNGTARLRIWDQRAEPMIQVRTHDIPFHQIIDTNTLTDNLPTHVQLSCHRILCHYANEDVLSVNLNTEALFWQETQQEIPWVEDLYHLEQDLKTDFSPLTLPCCTHCGTVSGNCIESIPTAHTPEQVLSVDLLCTSILPSEENTLKLILSYSLLYLDEMHHLRQLQKQQTCSFSIDRSLQEMQLTNLIFSTEVTPLDNQLTLHIKAMGQLMQHTAVTVPNLTDLCIIPATAKPRQPLKLIFVQESRPLWSIAKENRSTVRLIRECNRLAENAETVANTVLLVP